MIDCTNCNFPVWETIKPSSVPAKGGFTITVNGRDFTSAGKQFNCIFKLDHFRLNVVADIEENDFLTCLVDKWDHNAGLAELIITDESNRPVLFVGNESGMNVDIFQGWELSSLDGIPISSIGGGQISFIGYGFIDYPPFSSMYECIFRRNGTELLSSIGVVNSSRVVCGIPAWGNYYASSIQSREVGLSAASNPPISVTLLFHGLDVAYTQGDARTMRMIPTYPCQVHDCYLYFFAEWSQAALSSELETFRNRSSWSIRPISANGNQSIHISGSGFGRSYAYLCMIQNSEGRNVSEAAQFINAATLKCRIPTWPYASGAVFLRLLVSYDGFENSVVFRKEGASLSFNFYAEWNSISPSQAFASGGTTITILGSGFDRSAIYSVQFNNTFNTNCEVISSFEITCPMEEWQGSHGPVCVSLTENGGVVHVNSKCVQFQIFPFWFAIQDCNGTFPVSEMVEFKVSGFGFAREKEYICKFAPLGNIETCAESNYSSMAAVINPSTLLCKTPAWKNCLEHGTTSVLVQELPSRTVLYRNFTSNVSATCRLTTNRVNFYSSWSHVSPTSAPFKGGSVITVHGFGFSDRSSYQCDFQFSSGVASFVSTQLLMCISPASNISGTEISIIEDERIVSYMGGGNQLVFESQWNSIGTPVVLAKGGSNVTVRGQGFAEPFYDCVFLPLHGGSVKIGVGQSFGEDAIICKLPVWDLPAGKVKLGIQYRETHLNMTFIGEEQADIFEVREGWDEFVETSLQFSAKSSEPLHIKGYGFDSMKLYTCQFARNGNELIRTNVTVLDSFSVSCPLPVWGSKFSAGQRSGYVALLIFNGETEIPFTNNTYEVQDTLACSGNRHINGCSISFDTVWDLAVSSSSTSQVVLRSSSISVFGFGFDEFLTYTCQFFCFEDASLTAHAYDTTSIAKVESQTELVCNFSEWNFETRENISISILSSEDGNPQVAFQGAHPPFFWIRRVLQGIQTSTGSAAGGTEVHILGSFMPNLTAFCDFDGLLTKASFLSYNLYVCTTPTWLSASGVVPVYFIEVYPRPLSSSAIFNKYALPEISFLVDNLTNAELNQSCSGSNHNCFRTEVGSFYFYPALADIVPPFGDRRGLSDYVLENVSVIANSFGLTSTKNYTCHFFLKFELPSHEAILPRNSVTQSKDLGQICSRLSWGGFTDGSPPDEDYAINTFKCWILAPRNAQSLYVQFLRFDTELDWDFVEVWNCYDTGCSDKTLIRSLSGNPTTAESGTVSESGVVLVTFRSDELINKRGFEAKFEIFSVLSPPSTPLDPFRVVCDLPVWDIDTPWKHFVSKEVNVFLLESVDLGSVQSSTQAAVNISGASSFVWTQVTSTIELAFDLLQVLTRFLCRRSTARHGMRRIICTCWHQPPRRTILFTGLRTS
eukprot:748272-Hanusia_phi.AAC.6